MFYCERSFPARLLPIKSQLVNPDNEGHIYFQIINLSPLDIVLKKGDAIGQGIIKPYLTTEDDKASARRIGGFGSTDCNQEN